MLIRNKKAFARGLVLMASFIFVFILFFMPIFPAQEGGEKTNGLVFADHLFNTLSKGSANFFDPSARNRESVQARTETVRGTQVDLEVSLKDPAMQPLALDLARQTGLEAEDTGSGLHVRGDLHALLTAVITDSMSMYENNAAAVAARYGQTDGKAVMRAWWDLATAMIKPMQRAGQVDEAGVVNQVILKGIEPSYNFYGITPLKVRDNIPLVAGFLIFYVVYTMWYGFAIFELFEGVGLTMKKGAKQEV